MNVERAIGQTVVRVEDDSDAPVTGTVIGWVGDGERCHVAWSDDEKSWTLTEWADQLTAINR